MSKIEDKYINGLLNNNEYIIQEIYTNYYPSIVALVKKNSGNEADAWEVFQEGLILILKKARKDDFLLTHTFFSFFYGICYNLWRNELQKKRRNEVTLKDDNTYKVDPVVEDLMFKSSQLKLYKEKFQELGERCQKLMKLFLEQHMSFKEIAKVMGYGSENAAKKQKHKCQKQLILKIKADYRYKELSS